MQLILGDLIYPGATELSGRRSLVSFFNFFYRALNYDLFAYRFCLIIF